MDTTRQGLPRSRRPIGGTWIVRRLDRDATEDDDDDALQRRMTFLSAVELQREAARFLRYARILNFERVSRARSPAASERFPIRIVFVRGRGWHLTSCPGGLAAPDGRETVCRCEARLRDPHGTLDEIRDEREEEEERGTMERRGRPPRTPEDAGRRGKRVATEPLDPETTTPAPCLEASTRWKYRSAVVAARKPSRWSFLGLKRRFVGTAS